MSNQHTAPEPSEEQQHTRERIIAAASKVLAAKGYEATTLREISREAQAAPGLVHYYFGGKDQLISADQVNQVKAELTAKKVDFKMEVYPEAGHGFFCDDRVSYHEASAKDAWEKTKSFFKQHLK